MKHCMIDLETWGLRPGSAIRSIGAAGFEFGMDEAKLNLCPIFYQNITDKSCMALGLSRDQATIDWWDKQLPEAKSAFTEPQPIHLLQAAGEFNRWWAVNGFEYVWANGAAFDPVLWQAAVGHVPWAYNKVMDTRTAHFILDRKSSTPFTGVPHNALDDAMHQTRLLVSDRRALMIMPFADAKDVKMDVAGKAS